MHWAISGRSGPDSDNFNLSELWGILVSVRRLAQRLRSTPLSMLFICDPSRSCFSPRECIARQVPSRSVFGFVGWFLAIEVWLREKTPPWFFVPPFFRLGSHF